MGNPAMDDRKNQNDREPRLADKVSGGFIIIITAVVAFMMIVNVCQAYGERHQRLEEFRGRLSPNIKAMEMRLERATVDALNRLDPDYRWAEYERERNTLGPGEELLPTYDGPDDNRN